MGPALGFWKWDPGCDSGNLARAEKVIFADHRVGKLWIGAGRIPEMGPVAGFRRWDPGWDSGNGTWKRSSSQMPDMEPEFGNGIEPDAGN